MRLTIEIPDDIVEKWAKIHGTDKAGFVKSQKKQIERLIIYYYEESHRINTKEDFVNFCKMVCLNGIPD